MQDVESPHHHLPPGAPGDPGGGRPGRRDVPGLLGLRGDVPRARAGALPGGRRPSARRTGPSPGAGAAPEAPRGYSFYYLGDYHL